MYSSQQLPNNPIQQKPLQQPTSLQRKQDKPPHKSKQKTLKRKGQKPPHKAKQKPLQRKKETQIKENVSQLTGVDVSNTKIHYNSSKPAEVQAEATAQGDQVHLAPGKDQHLGHELAHVAQQAQGRVTPTLQAKNGVNLNNDPKLEKEADDIGDKAMKDEVNSFQVKSTTSNQTNDTPIQRYVTYERRDQFKKVSEEDAKIINPRKYSKPGKYSKKQGEKYDKQMADFDEKYQEEVKNGNVSERSKKLKEGWRHPQRKTLLVSNDGKMAVEGKGGYSKQAWADKSLIDKANQVLKDKKSYITLVEETSDLIVGSVPGKTEPNPNQANFKKIKPIHSDSKVKNQDMTKSKSTEAKDYGGITKLKLQDCGKANFLILGCLQENGDFANRVYKSKDGNIIVETGNAIKTIKNYILKLMQTEFPKKTYTDKNKAYQDYVALSTSDRNKIDEKYGLNVHARPGLGEGVTMVDTNRYEAEKEAKRTGNPSSETGYNFHFAANIMQSDDQGDYMALEGLADHPVWYFSMYGTQKGQSFHEKQTGEVGKPQISAIVDKDK